MPTAKRKCRNCGNYKPRENMIITPSNAAFCDPQCAWLWSSEKSIKAAQKATRKRKSELRNNDRRHQLKLAQANFNRFIRLRDVGLPCISCQRHHKGKMNAGHYRTCKAMPELRFNELNVHGQCEPCNSFLSGNITEYRINLIKKIGIEKVDWLESHHPPVKLTIDEIISIKKTYAAKARELERKSA